MFLFITSNGKSQADTSIAILLSDTLTSTQRTLHGAKKIIAGSHENAVFYSFLLNQNPAEKQSLIDSLKVLKPEIILTIGSPATSFAKNNFNNTPIVFAGVINPVLSGFVKSAANPEGNITGASLDIPTNIQFKYFKQIVPNMKKIGILYTNNTASLIPSAKVVAQQMGLTLVAIEIKDNKDIPNALDSLDMTVDGIWSVADPDLFDPQSTRYILLNTIRKSIPFMGFSRYVVESGALFALDFDYKAVGFQAGEMVNKILSGTKPGEIRVSTVDVIWFHYNEKTAKHINVTIPEDLVMIAKEVYR
ncbi:MAG: ABC transporter substrate-binding protein [bacterium]